MWHDYGTDKNGNGAKMKWTALFVQFSVQNGNGAKSIGTEWKRGKNEVDSSLCGLCSSIYHIAIYRRLYERLDASKGGTTSDHYYYGYKNQTISSLV